MKSIDTNAIISIAKQFNIEGKIVRCIPFGNGHINNTFLIDCEKNGETYRYILQSVNTNVFKKPEEVMINILKVTSFLREKAENPEDVMTLITSIDNKAFYIDLQKRFWRMLSFVENSICLELPETAEDFYQSAVAFGQFQHQLDDFPVEELYETIPDFHNTPKRFNDLLKAIDENIAGRAADIKEDIQFYLDRKDFCSVLYDANKEGKLPFRVTHNDTKINNVMLDAVTRKPKCVIDLDTIMPGFSVTDFGDSIRFGASTAAEDEKDLDKVWLDLELFETYAKGFLEGCGGLLSTEEIMLMPEGAKMMTLECGMRFLTDYLNGDTYFKTSYSEHNLVRARTHIKLVADMEKHWDEMKDIVSRCI